MDTSRLFTVEYSPSQREWRTEPLNMTLKANYESFLRGGEGRGVVLTPTGVGFVESDDYWMLLEVCSSLEEAKALASKFQEIKDRLERDVREARNSYIVQFPGSEKDSAQR